MKSQGSAASDPEPCNLRPFAGPENRNSRSKPYPLFTDELYIVRPELRSRGCAIRATDGDGKNLYRTPIIAAPAAIVRTR